MREVLYKLLLFLSPFILISLFTFIVDPYNLFNISNVISDEVKIKCLDRNKNVATRANATWRTIDFMSDPSPNIVLGDSRIAAVSEVGLQEKLNGKVSNLAIPSGNIRTICDLFWLATTKTKLNNVIIQIDFNRYDASVNFDLLLPVRQLIEKPYSYFFNANYVKDSFAALLYSMKNSNRVFNGNESQSDAIWNFSEQFMMRNLHYPDYIYPRSYFDELKRLSNYCVKNEINLLFVISPNYHTVNTYLKKFSYEDEYERFKSDIRSLGITIDLDVGLPISYSKHIYADHFHFQPYLADTLISLIFE